MPRQSIELSFGGFARCHALLANSGRGLSMMVVPGRSFRAVKGPTSCLAIAGVAPRAAGAWVLARIVQAPRCRFGSGRTDGSRRTGARRFDHARAGFLQLSAAVAKGANRAGVSAPGNRDSRFFPPVNSEHRIVVHLQLGAPKFAGAQMRAPLQSQAEYFVRPSGLETDDPCVVPRISAVERFSQPPSSILQTHPGSP